MVGGSCLVWCDPRSRGGHLLDVQMNGVQCIREGSNGWKTSVVDFHFDQQGNHSQKL